jgi:hypothetical protein
MAVAFEKDTAEFHLTAVMRQTGIREARQPAPAAWRLAMPGYLAFEKPCDQVHTAPVPLQKVYVKTTSSARHDDWCQRLLHGGSQAD